MAEKLQIPKDGIVALDLAQWQRREQRKFRTWIWGH